MAEWILSAIKASLQEYRKTVLVQLGGPRMSIPFRRCSRRVWSSHGAASISGSISGKGVSKSSVDKAAVRPTVSDHNLKSVSQHPLLGEGDALVLEVDGPETPVPRHLGRGRDRTSCDQARAICVQTHCSQLPVSIRGGDARACAIRAPMPS